MRVRALVLAVAMAVAVTSAVSLSFTDVGAKRDRLKPTPCTVEPRSVSSDSPQPAATPLPLEVAGFAADAYVTSPADLPQGESAQAETLAEIKATVQEYAGCVNSGTSLQLAALMTDNVLAQFGGVDAVVAALDSQRTGDPANRPIIRWLTVSDVRVLPHDRVGAIVDQALVAEAGGGTYTPTAFFVFERSDDRWLIDGKITIEPDAYDTISPDAVATPVVLDDEALLSSARNGFNEVDSAMYVEPTMAGAKFSLEAMVMVGFREEDTYPADVGCEIFIFERGDVSATVSANCRAGSALAGRAAYLDVNARGPLRSGSQPLYACEDVAPLGEYVVFSCTVELPPEGRR